MKDNPLVIVIIPVYNYDKYIAATLDSVFAQTYRPIEIIVVDDGSTDKGAEIISNYPEVRYFYQSNQGPAIARNVAISHANGEFIAFLDAGDQWQAKDYGITAAYIPKVLLYKRIHNSNLSGNTKINQKELLQVVKQSLDRQHQ